MNKKSLVVLVFLVLLSSCAQIEFNRKLTALQKEAEQGNTDAQLKMGRMYAKGEEVPQDDKEAAKWYLRAAEQGHVDAQFKIADMFTEGKGVHQNYKAAAKWYLKAAEQGHVNAQFILGGMYAKGVGVRQDEREAAKWYLKAAEQGHKDALFNLVNMNAKGKNNKSTPTKDYANAQFYLGRMYAKGIGVPRNDREASKWYLKAAQQGHKNALFSLVNMHSKGKNYKSTTRKGYANALFRLANMFNDGDGVSLDNVEAVKWYLKAAEQGHVDAQFKMGNIYAKEESGNAKGEFQASTDKANTNKGYSSNLFSLESVLTKDYEVVQDRKASAKWYLKAAQQGHVDAQFVIGGMYVKGEGVQQSYKTAAKWYLKAAQKGHVDAQFIIGEMYAKGEGVRQSNKTAAKWYLKAAKQGKVDAQIKIGEMYAKGQGVRLNYVAAMKWFGKVCDTGVKEYCAKHSNLEMKVAGIVPSRYNWPALAHLGTFDDIRNGGRNLFKQIKYVDGVDEVSAIKGRTEYYYSYIYQFIYEFSSRQKCIRYKNSHYKNVVGHLGGSDTYHCI